MTDDAKDLATQAAKAHLPPFCTVVEAGEMEVSDRPGLTSRKVLYVRFTFPGATGTGFWRQDLRDAAVVLAEDYDTYQGLKAKWREGELQP